MGCCNNAGRCIWNIFFFLLSSSCKHLKYSSVKIGDPGKPHLPIYYKSCMVCWNLTHRDPWGQSSSGLVVTHEVWGAAASRQLLATCTSDRRLKAGRELCWREAKGEQRSSTFTLSKRHLPKFTTVLTAEATRPNKMKGTFLYLPGKVTPQQTLLCGWSVQGARCPGQKAAPERNLSRPHHPEPLTRWGDAPATTDTLEGHSPGGTG